PQRRRRVARQRPRLRAPLHGGDQGPAARAGRGRIMKLVLEMTGADDGVAHRVVESFPVTLGRGYHNDIILADPHVGEQHIRIDYDGRDWTVTDLGSVNPLLVNMRPVAGPVRIVSGDELRVGGVRLRAFSPG